jgi:hypothetical protein
MLLILSFLLPEYLAFSHAGLLCDEFEHFSSIEVKCCSSLFFTSVAAKNLHKWGD